MKLALVLLVGLAGTAHADSVGVVVSGDTKLQASLTSAFTQRLERGGRKVVAAPLDSASVGVLVDCLVIEDPGCARSVVERSSRSTQMIYALAENAPANGRNDVKIVAYWFDKGRAPVTRRTTCEDCNEAKLVETARTVLVGFVGELPEQGAPSRAGVQPAREREGIAIGVELGEPSSATGGWYAGKLAVLAALGSGTFEGPGVSMHVDVQMLAARLAPQIPLRVGLGVRYYHHGYELMSVDEIPHTHYGVRASASLGFDRGPLQLYAELAPGVDFKRTRSCTFASGVDTICPHSQELPLFVQFVVGARWFLSH